MSLLFQLGVGKREPLKLIGCEVLAGPDPSICKVKGVMFSGRREFLMKELGERTFYSVISKLSSSVMRIAMHPLAAEWYDFSAIVEYDKAIYENCSEQHPHILYYIGAASAELGLSRVFQKLDAGELYAFLQRLTQFHEQYQRYGYLELERLENGARMHYHDYPCYSPIFCASGHGFLLEAIMRHGGRDASVAETKCHCRGDGVCTYELTWR